MILVKRIFLFILLWTILLAFCTPIVSQSKQNKMYSKNRTSLDFKINIFYAYLGENVNYYGEITNTKKYYFVPGYFEPPDGGKGKFFKSDQFQGLIKYEPYVPYEAELILRRSFFKGRIDFGIKTSYKYQKLAYGYYINSPNPRHTLNLYNVNQDIHFLTHGIQLGYNFIKSNISVRLGLDNNWSKTSDYFGLEYEDDSIYFATVQWFYGGLSGNFTWNFDIYRYINKNLFFGISSRFYLPWILSNGTFRETHYVIDKKTNQRLFTGQVSNLELYLGVHLGYTLPIYLKKSPTNSKIDNDIDPIPNVFQNDQNDQVDSKVKKQSKKAKKKSKNKRKR